MTTETNGETFVTETPQEEPERPPARPVNPLAVLGVMLKNYHRFLFGCLILGVSIVFPWFIGMSWFLGAAAKSFGMREKSVLWLTIYRGQYHIMLLFAFGFTACLLAVPAVIINIAHSQKTGAEGNASFWLSWAAMVLLLLLRFWPFYVCSYIYKGSKTWRSHYLPWTDDFQGPSFITAWRMTT